MEFDRDIARAREQAAGNDADFDPGKRTNTDRMPPTPAAGPARLYQKASPLAGPSEEIQTSHATFKLPEVEGKKPRPQPKAKGPVRDAPKAAAMSAHAATPKPAAAASPAASAASSTTPTPKPAAPSTTPTPKPAAPAPTAHAKPAGQDGGLGGSSGAHAPAHPGAAPAAATQITSQTHHVAPGDSSPTRTNIGVGEEVTLTAPSSGTWAAPASTGTPSGSGTTFEWKAPDVAGPVTITFTPTTGAALTKPFTVVAPTDIRFSKVTDMPQAPAGAGLRTNLHVNPQTVSFYNAEWLEVPGPAVVDGYYRQTQLQAGRDLFHHPAADWISMSGSTNNGVDDQAYTAGHDPLHRRPTDLFGAREYFDGQWDWEIPNKYRVAGGPAEGHEFTRVHQHFTMNAAGTVSVTKGGQVSTQNAQGWVDTATMELEHYATSADALAMLTSGRSAAQAVTYGLGLLTTYRTSDPASFSNIVSALQTLTPVIYVGVRCTNTFAWTSADDVSITLACNGTWTTQTTINTNQVRVFRVPWTQVINPQQFGSTQRMTTTITAEGHTFSVSVPLPFNEYGHTAVIPGSDNRYTLTSYLV